MHETVIYILLKKKSEVKCLLYPSISDSNWFIVWFAYGWRTEFVRLAPTESISSINITAGALSFAASKSKSSSSISCEAICAIQSGSARITYWTSLSLYVHLAPLKSHRILVQLRGRMVRQLHRPPRELTMFSLFRVVLLIIHPWAIFHRARRTSLGSLEIQRHLLTLA